MLAVRDLRVQKSGKTICHVPELEVAVGECVTVVGPNGSGKTTLLRVAAGLEHEMTGSCTIQAPVRNRVYVHQDPYLFRGTALSNVRYGLAARRGTKPEQIAEARYWLDVFGVAHLADRRGRNFSGGERRRVALARAFAVRAEFLLLDEPFAELDREGVEVVCQAIANTPETTILIASPTEPVPRLSTRTFSLSCPIR